MKKIILLIAAVLFTGMISLSAQEAKKQTHKPMHHKKDLKEKQVLPRNHENDISKIAEELELTEQQKKELETLFQKHAENSKQRHEKMKEQAKQEKEDLQAEMIKIIGQEKYDQLKEKSKYEAKERRRVDANNLKRVDTEKPHRMLELKELPEKK